MRADVSKVWITSGGASWIPTLKPAKGLKASLVAQMVKNLPAVLETQVQSLGQEDPLKKGMATHSSILAWRIPWTEDPGWLQSMRLQRVTWLNSQHTQIWGNTKKLSSSQKKQHVNDGNIINYHKIQNKIFKLVNWDHSILITFKIILSYPLNINDFKFPDYSLRCRSSSCIRGKSDPVQNGSVNNTKICSMLTISYNLIYFSVLWQSISKMHKTSNH